MTSSTSRNLPDRRDRAARLSREPREGIRLQPDLRTLRVVGVPEFFVRGAAGEIYQRRSVPRGRRRKSNTSRITGSRSTTIKCSSAPAARRTTLGFLLTADAIWPSGYRRGFANSGELPPIIQFNAAIVRNFPMPGRQGRGANQHDQRLRPYLPDSQRQRDRGFFAVLRSPPRFVRGINIPLASMFKGSP